MNTMNRNIFPILLGVLALALGAWMLFGAGPADPVVPPGGNNATSTNGGQTGNGNATSTMMDVKFAAILIEDNGARGKKIGCNDSVVFVDASAPRSAQVLNESFRALFRWEAPNPPGEGELYTVVPQTNLEFDRATVENGVARVYLTGNPGGLGGVCDTPRLPAQIEETALQFDTVDSVETYINGERFDWQAWARGGA